MQTGTVRQPQQWLETSLQNHWSWKETEGSGTGTMWSGCPWDLWQSRSQGGRARSGDLHTAAQMASHTWGTRASLEEAGKVCKGPRPSSQ